MTFCAGQRDEKNEQVAHDLSNIPKPEGIEGASGKKVQASVHDEVIKKYWYYNE